MKNLAARLAALAAASPACRHCAGLSQTAIIEGSAAEIADRAYVDAHLPHPRRCPSCGRPVIRLIRLYGTGGASVSRIGEGGL